MRPTKRALIVKKATAVSVEGGVRFVSKTGDVSFESDGKNVNICGSGEVVVGPDDRAALAGAIAGDGSAFGLGVTFQAAIECRRYTGVDWILSEMKSGACPLGPHQRHTLNTVMILSDQRLGGMLCRLTMGSIATVAGKCKRTVARDISSLVRAGYLCKVWGQCPRYGLPMWIGVPGSGMTAEGFAELVRQAVDYWDWADLYMQEMTSQHQGGNDVASA